MKTMLVIFLAVSCFSLVSKADPAARLAYLEQATGQQAEGDVDLSIQVLYYDYLEQAAGHQCNGDRPLCIQTLIQDIQNQGGVVDPCQGL